jgi:hypothetical protein
MMEFGTIIASTIDTAMGDGFATSMEKTLAAAAVTVTSSVTPLTRN